MVVDIQLKFTDLIMAVPGKEHACGPFGLALTAEGAQRLSVTFDDPDRLLVEATFPKSIEITVDCEDLCMKADAQADAEMEAYFQDDPGCPGDYFHG